MVPHPWPLGSLQPSSSVSVFGALQHDERDSCFLLLLLLLFSCEVPQPPPACWSKGSL